MVSKVKKDEFIDFTSEGVIVIDSEFRIVSMNYVLEKWLEKDLCYDNPSCLFNIFPEIKQKKFYKRFKKLFVYNAPGVLSSLIHGRFIDIKHSSETWMTQETLIHSFIKDGKKLGIICIKDVTDHCKSLQMVKETCKKNQILAVKKLKFLSSISHDLRTPLNGIIGTLDLLKDSSLDKEQGDLVETISKSSGYLLSLINDFLDISKIESSQFLLEKNNINITSLVMEIEKLFEPQFDKKNIHFEVSYLLDSDLMVQLDGLRLKQVLINLIENALKFTSSGEVKLLIEKDEKNLKFTITDTGKGIGEDEKEFLFDSFSKDNRMFRETTEGTGLGLSIVKSILKAMSGQIHFEGQLGKGTKVSFSIPFEDSKDENGHKVRNKKILLRDYSHISVLVAEDNIVNQKIIQKFFEKFKIQTTLTENGKDAFSEFKKSKFDFVFLDYQMPLLNGVEVAQKIMELRPSNRPLLIAVSANALDEDRKLFFDNGFDYVLPKPYDFNKFSNLIIEIVERKDF